MELFPRNEIYVTANRENGCNHASFKELNAQNFYTCSLFEDDPEKYGSMKEEIDIIDGVHFISFESESDLCEFTRKQKMDRNKLRDRKKMYGKKGRIISQKTHDITKLKEWRTSSTNKPGFDSCSTEESGCVKSTDASGCVKTTDDSGGVKSTGESGCAKSTGESGRAKSTDKSGRIKSTDASGCVKSTDASGCVKSTDASGCVKTTDDSGGVKSTDASGCVKTTDDSGGVKPTDESGCVKSTDESDLKVNQTETDVQNDTNEIVTPHMISSNRIFLREFPDKFPRMYDLCFSEKHPNILRKINKIYLGMIKKDKFLKKIENKLSDRTSNEGVFQCSLVDEFLENDEHFEVSYAKRGSRERDEAKYEEAKELLLMSKDTKLPSDIIDVDGKHKDNHSEEVAEAFAKFDAFAKKTNKFKLKNYIVIGGQRVQLDFGESNDSDSEVKNVVDDAIDYILRKEAIEKLDYPFDPDINSTALSTTKRPVVKKIKKSKIERELGRLTNVTLIKESKSNDNSCEKEYCSKGCVCQSLEGIRSILHCKKTECMFKCSCDNKNNSPREKIVSNGVIKNKLAKEESLWHKTVICKSNDIIIEGESEKAKREKKLPTRFRDNLLYSSPNPQTSRMDKTTYTIKNSPKGFDSLKKPFLPKPKKNHDPKKSTEAEKLSSFPKKKQPPKLFNSAKEPLKDELNVSEGLSDNCNQGIWKEDFLPSDFDEESWIEMEEVIVSSDEEDLVKVTDPLEMAYIWCEVHNTYNCQCCNSIFFLKRNTICRCRDLVTSFSQKHVSEALNNAYNFSLAHLHDRNAYSARTFGTHINYGIRNKRSDFKKKRKLEMHYEILSNTNSLYKLSPLQLRYDVKKEKIIEYIKPSVVAHNVNVGDIVVNAEASDTLDDLEETEIDVRSKPLSLNQQPLIKNQFIHVQQAPLGQSPSDSVDQLTSQQTANIKHKSVIVAFEKSVEPEEKKRRMRKTYRIGPAHFETSHSFRPIKRCPKPKFKKSCDSKIADIDKNQDCDIMPNSYPPVFQSSQNTTTDNLNSTVNIVSGKDCAISLLNENSNASETHNLGLLCLTDGFGYLPVNHFSSTKLCVRDPLCDDFYHEFYDLKAANIWLNRFFKSRVLFEDLNYDLKWIIIKPNLIPKMKLFDNTFLLYDTKVVNKNGVLMDKTLFTREYIRASKKLQFQTYKADVEQASFPSNNTVKCKTRIINLGNHAPGSTKRYKIAIE